MPNEPIIDPTYDPSGVAPPEDYNPNSEHDPEAIAPRKWVKQEVNDFTKEYDPYENYTTPELYGDMKCPVCLGRGRVNVPNPPGYKGPGALRLCRCVLIKEVLNNIERARAGMSKAKRVPRSPLVSRIGQNIRVAADECWFDAHMRHVALRQPPRWDFRIVTDADLVQAWLATAAAKGMEIFDADVRGAMEMRSLTYMTLTDIAKSATLLVIRLGVKAAPNKEMPNVLLEVILTRKNEGLATWLWEPSSPHFRLAQGHICWSEFVEAEVGDWEQVVGTEADLEREVSTKPLERKKLVQERVRLAAPPPPPVAPPPPPDTPEEVEEEEEGESSSGYDVSAAMGRIGEPSDKPKYKKSGFSSNKGKGRR